MGPVARGLCATRLVTGCVMAPGLWKAPFSPWGRPAAPGPALFWVNVELESASADTPSLWASQALLRPWAQCASWLASSVWTDSPAWAIPAV